MLRLLCCTLILWEIPLLRINNQSSLVIPGVLIRPLLSLVLVFFLVVPELISNFWHEPFGGSFRISKQIRPPVQFTSNMDSSFDILAALAMIKIWSVVYKIIIIHSASISTSS